MAAEDVDERDEEDEELAMQVRCTRCLGEQYVLNVIAFSNGVTGCTVCGHPSQPMTYEQWYDALRRARQAGDAG